MKARFLLLFLLFTFAFVFATSAHAQGSSQKSSATAAPEITTTEAQSLADAMEQTDKHVRSIYLLALAQLVVALVTLSLLFNLRSLAFLFLIAYGAVILCVPYYIPSAFQITFGGAIIVMAVVGLLLRLMLGEKKPAKKAPPATPPTAAV